MWKIWPKSQKSPSFQASQSANTTASIFTGTKKSTGRISNKSGQISQIYNFSKILSIKRLTSGEKKHMIIPSIYIFGNRGAKAKVPVLRQRGLGRQGKEHSPKRGSSRKTVCVGVQSNRLCTLTVLVEELFFMNVDLMEQWEDRCSFYCTAVGTVTKGSRGGNLFGWRTKDETGVTGYV